MVDTTSPKCGTSAVSPQGEAGAPEITSAMIEAGVEVLWKSGAIEHPMEIDRDLVRSIYLAMTAAQSCQSAPSCHQQA